MFISYRREDSSGTAGRIYDRLTRDIDRETVFLDVDNLELGIDYVEALANSVGECDALIAVIGRKWLNAADKQGRRRLDNPRDLVRVEVEAALGRNVLVIPVLVDGAPMPDAEDLPGGLGDLAYRNALEISHAKFHSDLERLLRVLRKRLDECEAQRQAKIEEGRQQAAAARIEEERQRAEAARIEEQTQRAEAARIEAERQRAEAARIEEERQRAAAVRIEEERQQAEAARIEEERQRAEAARIEAERQRAEAARIEEERRQAEAARVAEERQQAEAAAFVSELRQAKAARVEEERQRAEAARLEEERREAEAPSEGDSASRAAPAPTTGQRDSDTPKRWVWIALAGLCIVAGLGVAAWRWNEGSTTSKLERATASVQSKAPTQEDQPSSPSAKQEPWSPPQTAKAPSTDVKPTPSGNANSGVPVAHRAALLVEAPGEPNKIKTFLGTVVWKLDDAPQGANAAGPAVEADIDLPDDKMKVVVIFEKNSDASLPASHTIKVRFDVEPGSFSGNAKQIGVPLMRREATPSGESLAGVTAEITTNSFLVGLSPGNAEAANTDLIRSSPWIDVPMELVSGKIAKLTFEKGKSGQRDLDEAFVAWQKH